MVAGSLDNGYELPDVTLASGDLYAYTFEAPSGVCAKYLGTAAYANIHNTINRNDPVPFMAPTVWNFKKYTKSNHFLPTQATNDNFSEELNTMKYFFQKISDGAEYKIQETVPQYTLRLNSASAVLKGYPLFTASETDIPTEEALNYSFSTLFTKVIPSRSYYYNNLQTGFQDLLTKLYGGSNSSLMDNMTFEEFLQTFFSQLSNERFLSIVSPLISSPNALTNISQFRTNCDTFVSDVLDDSSLWRNIQFTTSLKSTVKDLFYNFMSAATDDVMKNNGYNIQALANVIALIKEGSLFQAHYGEITLSWLMAQDINYNIKPLEINNFQCTRNVKINCPVDIEVYDDQNRLRAKFVNDEVQDVGDIGLSAFIDTDGEKVIYLPPDGSYHLKITARDEGTVTISIGEYSFVKEAYTRLQNYYYIPIISGDVLSLDIPKMTGTTLSTGLNSSDTVYTLLSSDGTEIEPNADIKGSAQANVLFTVTAESENDLGYVIGGGEYTRGSFAEVNAYPSKGGKFVGWYLGNKLVSTDECYRFAVSQNWALVAKFEEAPEETETQETMESTVETESETITESAAETESQAVTESAAEVESQAVTESAIETESQAITESAAEPESQTITESAVETESQTITESAVETEFQAITESAAESESQTSTKPASETESQIVTESTEKAVSQTVIDFTIETESQTATDSETQTILESPALSESYTVASSGSTNTLVPASTVLYPSSDSSDRSAINSALNSESDSSRKASLNYAQKSLIPTGGTSFIWSEITDFSMRYVRAIDKQPLVSKLLSAKHHGVGRILSSGKGKDISSLSGRRYFLIFRSYCETRNLDFFTSLRTCLHSQKNGNRKFHGIPKNF